MQWNRLWAGNWLGAALVAVVCAGVSGVLGLGLALLAKPVDFGLSNTLTLATVTATGAFGADLSSSLEATSLGEFAGSARLGFFPFTVSLVALVVAAVVFRRVTRTYANGVDAALDAVRAALIFGLLLLVPALVFRSDNSELGRGWGAELDASNIGVEAEVGARAAEAFFLGALVLLVVLLATVLVRRDWLPPLAARVHDWVQAPLVGFAVLVCTLPVAGLVGLVSMGLFGEDTSEDLAADETRAAIAVVAAFLANGGAWLLALGGGSRIGYVGDSSDSAPSSEWSRLWGEVTESEPGLWIAPVVLLVLLALATLVVVRRSRPQDAARNLVVWVASFVVLLPLLVRVTNAHGSASLASDGEEFSGDFMAGIDGWQTLLLLGLVAAVVALVAALMTGVLSATVVRTSLSGPDIDRRPQV